MYLVDTRVACRNIAPGRADAPPISGRKPEQKAAGNVDRAADVAYTRKVASSHQTGTRERGPAAHKAGPAPARWAETYAELTAAQQRGPLEPADLERLAMAAYLTGHDAESTELLGRAHQECLQRGDAIRAARCACWIAFSLITQGERAAAGGWIARAERVLDEGHHGECGERGYLLVLQGVRLVGQGDIAGAHTNFVQAADIGGRVGDRDLQNLARQGCGRALIQLGEIARGMALLDEVMVAVTAGELSPVISGTIYCSVISVCFDTFDIRRAREWTEALARWCESQPDAFPYRGQCLVHRAEILRLGGVWPDAMDEALRACACLARPARPAAAIGAARYQVAELHRLRGEFAEAEEAYRQASEAGRTPHPGLAQLRLAQGRIDAAKAAICRVVDDVRDPRGRAHVLAAAVEILLAADDVVTARHAADELTRIAAVRDTPFLQALSAQSTGAVLLAEDDAKAALVALHEALSIWRDLEAPYETARVTVSIGLACRALGDADSAQIEFDSARRAFEQLGAVPDVARVDRLAAAAPSAAGAGGLTAREVQVLQAIASGRSNRAIAGALGISEKTVARHISNIFTKLDLSSRAAATAYAFQHNLVEREPT